jgi:acyl-CoA oxidase
MGLTSELSIGRYQMPPPNNPTSYVALHESSLISEAKALLGGPAKGDHRSEAFINRDILPLSLPLVEAIGYRLAFEAAQETNIDPEILSLYERGVIKENSPWYTEKGGLSRELQREMESQAADHLLPHLKGIMQDSGLQNYCNVPMTSKAL